MTLDYVEGAVLAGGASSRMGRDKAGVEWEGVPMLERVTDALRACITTVRVVVRPGAELPGGFDGLERIEDRYPERAPIVGVHAALSACSEGSAGAVVVCACDLPQVDPRVVLALLALTPVDGGADVVAPMGPEGPEPLLAVYRPRLLGEIERRIESGRLSLRALLREVDSLLVPQRDLRRVDPELRALRNVNEPGDL